MRLQPGRNLAGAIVWALMLAASLAQSATFFHAGEFSETEFDGITGQQLFYIGRQSMPLIGENQEESLTSAVFPGVPNGSFTAGTDSSLGVTLQSNLDKINPLLPQPGGNLVLAGPIAGVPFSRIGTSELADSLDIMIEPPLYPSVIWAMSFAVRAGFDNDQPVTMRIYNNAGGLMGITNFPAGAEHVGFLVDFNGLLRVNFSADDYVEVGEIRIYSKVGAPDAEASTVFASSTTNFVDLPVGITVSVSDERGQLRDMGRDDVLITTTIGSSLTTIIDQEDGTYTAWLSRQTPGAATVRAYLGTSISAPLIGEVAVTFTTGRAAALTAFEVDDEVINFNGGSTTGRVALVDSFGNIPPAGIRVVFESSDTNRAVVAAEALSDYNGTATVAITAGAQVGAVTISASIDSADGNVASNDLRVASLLIRDPDATVTISGWAAQGRTYDRTTNAAVSGDAVLNGIQPGHAVALAGTPEFYFRSPEVGTDKRVDVFGITLAGADAGLYALELPVLTASIAPVILTVAGAVALDKPFDTTTDAVITGATLEGVLEGDDVALLNAAFGTFQSSEIGVDWPVVTMMTLGGSDAGNYLLPQPVLTASIFYSPNLFVGSSELDGPEFSFLTNLFLLGRQAVPAVVAETTTNAVLFGSDPALGITYSSNVNSEDTAAVTPGEGLYLMPPDGSGPDGRMGPSVRNNSLDLQIAPPGFVGLIQGVSMAVRVAGDASTIRVRLYHGGGLMGEHVYPAGTQRIGIFTDLPGLIRINLFAPDGDLEVGTVSLYSGVGPSDAGESTLDVVSSSSLFADEAAELLVTLRDATGSVRGQGGEDVLFVASAGTLFGQTDKGDGTYGVQLAYTNDAVAEITVRAYLGISTNDPLIGTQVITFAPARAEMLANATAGQSIIVPDDQTTVSVLVLSRYGQVREGIRVHFASSDTNVLRVVAHETLTGSNGIGVMMITGVSTGIAAITVSIDGDDANVSRHASAVVTIAVVAPFEITAIARQQDQFVIAWQSEPGFAYTVQRSVNLLGSPAFSDWVTRVASNAVEFVSDDFTAVPHLYRIRLDSTPDHEP